MEQAYAQALWSITTKGASAKDAIASLRALLEREGRSTLLLRIGKALQRIAAREERRQSLTLSVASEKDAKGARAKAEAVLKEMGVDSEGLKTQVDDTLIGGWRLEGREVLIDASYKQDLLDIYNRSIA
jgi:F0F1-type ATP synthase delta subunit